jgi:hypothetical protein
VQEALGHGILGIRFSNVLSISFTATLLLRKNDVINIKAITCKQNTIKLLECHKEI